MVFTKKVSSRVEFTKNASTINSVPMTIKDDKQSKKTHWVSLFIGGNTAVHFDSFGMEYIPQEVLSKIKDKSITHNIFAIQDDDSIIYGCYFIAFIEYMIAEKLC